MGCDGGTIPTRDELVRLKKKPEQKDKDSVRLYKWRHCSLSQEALSKPILACELGRLYNKESILRHLLDRKDPQKTDLPRSHLRGLKDTKELILTPNPALERSKDFRTGGDPNAAPFVCPITGLEMNGRFRFVFDWNTGRVISERAYKILKDDPADKILEENLIILNPEEEGDEIDTLKTKMESRRARQKAAKKSNKRSKNEVLDEEEAPSVVKKAKAAKDIKAPSKPSNDSSSASSSSSVQSDDSKSEVYKSIFSSHPKAQNQPKGNWVTFDPRYN
uniref:Replication termination factor 2 n=1 Tax=Caligus rogercresseyi TaxID=217165 RepID=C1BQF9_CALRO|nr:UPF0549 protein C20orf43 homolog [Caligus rogercresseyi]